MSKFRILPTAAFAVLFTVSGFAVAAESPTPLTDAEIAQIMTTANQMEVEAGKIAAEKGSTKEVKAYAQQMVNDHSKANEEAAALAKKNKITPKESALSKSLKTEGEANLSRLKALKSGGDFDRTYVGTQISMHQKVLDTIDNSLLASARNPELRAMLDKKRPQIQQHLTHAKRMHGGPASADNREKGGMTTE